MASKEAQEWAEENICKKLCDACIMSNGSKCNSYNYAVEGFDAGVAAAPTNAELVELQALREVAKLLRDKSKWHNPEELPIQQENEVKKLFLIKFTMNHLDEVHVGCGYFSFSSNKFTFPVSFILQDTCKLISWKEIE